MHRRFANVSPLRNSAPFGALIGALVAALIAPEAASAAGEPAGGAAMEQVIGATAGATIASAALVWALARHRAGTGTALARLSARVERLSGLPGWAALPSAVAAVALNVALLGMYWDIALHADQGRDAGPLANPAHYLILFGLFGVFAAGCLAIALPRGERPGPAAVRLVGDWYAPVGGLLMALCGAFALVGFPLDDVWHRLFGQDVTLWGPTHLMLFGGAGLTLVGQAALLAEGMRARRRSDAHVPSGRTITPSMITATRRIGLMGGLLIGLSTFQAEFDFGVPQFQLVFQPLLIALAAGVALVAARIWIGRGGALGAAVFFLVIRGAVSLLVGPVFGETTPALPLYLGEALCVEIAAIAFGRRGPVVIGAAGGLLAGTVGFWSEWAWASAVMPLPWTQALLPEGLVSAAIAGVAGGLVGGLLGAALRGGLPRPLVARSVFGVSLVAVAALVANGLAVQETEGVRANVTLTDTHPAPNREASVTVRLEPRQAAEDHAWITVTAWQGGGLVVNRLERMSEGVYRSTQPIPLHGEWKSVLRLHRGRELLGAPIFMPEDRAIPAREVAAPSRFTRTFTRDTDILQRERKSDVPSWLWTAASLVVLAMALAFIGALAWGMVRVGRRRQPRVEPPPRRTPRVTTAPAGART